MRVQGGGGQYARRYGVPVVCTTNTATSILRGPNLRQTRGRGAGRVTGQVYGDGWGRGVLVGGFRGVRGYRGYVGDGPRDHGGCYTPYLLRFEQFVFICQLVVTFGLLLATRTFGL